MIAAFEKTERVRHLGHLDLLRAMQRALRRSGLPIRYSQGFNPHVVLSFASPLPVGVSGNEELMDVALDSLMSETAFMKGLSPAMPDSLPLVSARGVDDKHPKLMALLQTASYEALLPVGDASAAMAEAIPALLSRREITAIRKTKSGEKECDIRPMLHALEASGTGTEMLFTFRVSLTEKETLKPDLLFRTLAAQAGLAEPPTMRLRRTRLYGAEADGAAVPLMEL